MVAPRRRRAHRDAVHQGRACRCPTCATSPRSAPTLDVAWAEVPDPSALTLGSTRKQFTYGADGRSWRRHHPQPQVRGRLVGSRSGVHRLLLRPHQRRLDRRARRPGVELRPGARTLTARGPLRREPRLHEHPPRRARQHHRGALRRPHPGRGRRGRLSACSSVTTKGESFPFARNARTTASGPGPCFSPDGRTLFANLQEPAVKVAITGPFNTIRPGA